MAVRIILLLVIFQISAFAASVKAEPLVQEFFPFLGEITQDNVNIRAGQSANYEKLSTLSKESLVVVLDKNYSWYRVQLPQDTKCYLSADYVLTLKDSKGLITGSRVNVRARPSVNASILGQVVKDQEVEIIEKDKDWVAIKPPDEFSGWISDDLLVFKSKDLSAYTVTVAKVKKSEIKENTSPEPQAQLVEVDTSRAVVGLLEPITNASSDLIHHRLIIDGNVEYYIEGLKHILNDFLYYNVRIEGKVSQPANDQFSHPVIKINKVVLVL